MIAALLAAAGLICGGCIATSAPHGWPPSSQEVQTDTYGAWAEITRDLASEADYVYGELIAVHEDSIFVMDSTGLVGLSRTQLTSVRLTTYEPEYGRLSSWTALGSVSTLSHGLGLVFTLPLWVIVGSATTASASGEPDEHCNDVEIKRQTGICWRDLSKFARFPQGLPATVDRGSLQSKLFKR